MHITTNKTAKTMKIGQSQYITDVLARSGMDQCNATSTPIDLNQKLTEEMCPNNDDKLQQMKDVPYMEAVGSLLFAAQITRPDVCFVVNMLSRFSQNPSKARRNAVKRGMRYLKGTVDKSLIYIGKSSEIIGFCDADWDSDIDSRRSTTGYVFIHQGAAISWATRRQRTIALSTTEAKFMSLVAAVQEFIWFNRFQKELIGAVTKSMVIYCDNRSAIHIATNKAKLISEAIKNDKIVLQYFETNNMLADL